MQLNIFSDTILTGYVHGAEDRVETLRELRRRKGLSQKDLAIKSEIGQDSISAIESGRHEARPSTLRKLAEALDVEVADFFQEPEVPKEDAPPSLVVRGGEMETEIYDIPSSALAGDVVYAKLPVREGCNIVAPPGWMLAHYHIENGQPFAFYRHVLSAKKPHIVEFSYVKAQG